MRKATSGSGREREPLSWAMSQKTLGNALEKLGERENGTALRIPTKAPCCNEMMPPPVTE